MQTKTILISGLLSLAPLVAAADSSSTDISTLAAELPSCSLACLISGASSADCDATDYACQCNSQQTVQANATACLTQACSVADISTTQSIVLQICASVGGSSNATTTASSSSSSSSAASSSSASASSSTSENAGARTQVLGGFSVAAFAAMAAFLAL